MHLMEETLERLGPTKNFNKILDKLEEIIEEGKRIIDPGCSLNHSLELSARSI